MQIINKLWSQNDGKVAQRIQNLRDHYDNGEEPKVKTYAEEAIEKREEKANKDYITQQALFQS